MSKWDIHNFCPVCKSKATGGCRCMRADKFCENGHEWFICFPCGKTVIGESNHASPLETCQCNEAAFIRTEV